MEKRGWNINRMGSPAILRNITAIILILIAPTACKRAEWQANNRAWMEHVGSILTEYESKKGVLPRGIDEALTSLNVKLPNRGDVNGKPMAYMRLTDHAFYLKAGEVDSAKNPRIVLFYINRSQVTEDTFFDKLKGEIDAEGLDSHRRSLEN